MIGIFVVGPVEESGLEGGQDQSGGRGEGADDAGDERRGQPDGQDIFFKTAVVLDSLKMTYRTAVRSGMATRA